MGYSLLLKGQGRHDTRGLSRRARGLNAEPRGLVPTTVSINRAGLYSSNAQGDSVDTCPQFFRCHPNLDDEVNRNIVESEIEGGAFLEDLPARAMLQIQTQHRWYTVVHRGRGEAWIWGHPAFCPEPVLVRIEGSSWGGSMLKIGFVGRGMHLEFRHPSYRTPIVTSRILEIRQCEQSEWEMTIGEYETHPTN
jgi:hypothetical protein